jgi:hypothetical protein
MRFLSTRIHGALDYIVAIVLIGLFEIAVTLVTRTETAPLHRDATAKRP